MAFGKVTVRSESGEMQEYELTQPVSSVGRQPGNEIVLNTSAVSRYHAQFAVADGLVYLVDLGTVNGTFVNDAQVEPNSRVPLSNGDRIIMGDVLLTFHSPEARARLDIDLTPTASIVEDPAVPYRLILDEPHQLVAPGARMQLVLVVESLADQEMALQISTEGLEPGWVRVNRREALLGPGEQAEVTITVVPPRSSVTHPGRYALTVRVAPADASHAGLAAVREIDVVGYSGLALAAQPQRDPNTYRVSLQNQGNVPLELELGGFDPDGVLSYQYRPPRLQVAPGAAAHASLRVGSRKRLRSADPLTFAVVARSLDAAGFQAPVLAEYTPTTNWLSRLTVLTLAALVGSVLLIVLVVAGVFLLDIWPLGGEQAPAAVAPAEATAGPTKTVLPTPTLIEVPDESLPASIQIVSFTANPAEVAYRIDQEIVLTWQIDGALRPDRIQLIDRIGQFERSLPLSREALGAGEIRVPVYEFQPGVHNFELRVLDADGEPVVQSLAGVAVTPTICQVLDPETVVRVAPAELAVEASPSLVLSEVLIAGRSPDAEWAWVAYNDVETLANLAWLSAGEIACLPGVVLDDYVAVDPGGAVLATPQPPASDSGSLITNTPQPGTQEAVTATPSG